MTDELKPCPFCGGKARLYGTSSFTFAAPFIWYVDCTKCRVVTEYMKTDKGAINRWNRRISK